LLAETILQRIPIHGGYKANSKITSKNHYAVTSKIEQEDPVPEQGMLKKRRGEFQKENAKKS
jgi:hypothetical protein